MKTREMRGYHSFIPGSCFIKLFSKVREQRASIQLSDLFVFDSHFSIAVDSRQVRLGDIFIALAHPTHDGHFFLDDAIKRGASTLVINRAQRNCLNHLTFPRLSQVMVIMVDNTVHALIAAAKAWRSQCNYPVVGITGSLGKTSTKEMIRSIMSAHDTPVHISCEQGDDLVAFCLSVLQMKKSDKVAIFELGIREKGDMDLLVDIVRPTIGLVTGIAHDHFDVLQDIVREKTKLFRYFSSDNIGIVWGDFPLLANPAYSHPVVKFGLQRKNHIQARNVTVKHFKTSRSITQLLLKIYHESALLTLQGHHKGLVYNALAASAVAHFLRIPIDSIVKGLESFAGCKECFEYKKMQNGRGHFISDCASANPESMWAALSAFHQLKVLGDKVAVLGDMLDLGDNESFWHRQVGRMLTKTPSIDSVLLVGTRAYNILKTAPLTLNTSWVPNWWGAQEKLDKMIDKQDSFVLVKASKSIGLDRIVESF